MKQDRRNFLKFLLIGGVLLLGRPFRVFASPAAPNPGHLTSEIEPGSDGQVLTTSGETPTWALVTDTNFATANKDGVAGTASLRTLGTGAQQAAAGNHTH